jgi:hypothetical protein
MADAKYDYLRYLSGTTGLDWENGTFRLHAVSGYTFSSDHASIPDIEAAGGTTVSYGELTGGTLSSTGVASSLPVVIPDVPMGIYDIILTDSTNKPLVFFNAQFDSGEVTTGVTVYPFGATDIDTVGEWFQF